MLTTCLKYSLINPRTHKVNYILYNSNGVDNCVILSWYYYISYECNCFEPLINKYLNIYLLQTRWPKCLRGLLAAAELPFQEPGGRYNHPTFRCLTMWSHMLINNCAINIISIESATDMQLIAFNDVRHLPENLRTE